ncbi:aldehyde ferredoxin oxidoreductase N-terminal domain-containing protein [Paucidesulfovibrio longus]|uniref:aldehyde ferredoxin oxidoreductase N-terminal domain-containing protein n=1 Tax=Paucidesulfovibrio longus TaxID=889 RepID=UPI0003B62C98|nr:aldehyde ferredoxin oxidoreductase C-terminal domain-containing protein [Paucidesulfovibrio longus]
MSASMNVSLVRDHFRVLVADLGTGRSSVEEMDGRDAVAGGSGLAALLFGRYGLPDQPWDHPDQPLILAVGPLTGLFPLMSKTVAAFKSPYHDQYTESHAGGRSALCLAYAGYDALVVRGRAAHLSCLCVGSQRVEMRDVRWMAGWDAFKSGKSLRKMFPGSGHRSILRVGPAGENGSAMACINVDTYRHFGRMGGGGVMGSKNLKAVVLLGDGVYDAPGGKEYAKLFQQVHTRLTDTDMMRKYHDLGTAGNVAALNELKSLPWRNLQQTTDPDVGGISGESFAEKNLLRNMACAGCPVGCIHIGYVREKFQEDHRFFYRQVSYDYELIFALGSMLGVTEAAPSLMIMDRVEKTGLDAMSAGVALAWAAEALEKGVVTEEQTLLPLKFGDAVNFEEALDLLAGRVNEFWSALAMGVPVAAAKFGGGDFACVLGQEMAGYATGEVFFTSQSMGFRHSHLDAGGYAWDQQHQDQDLEAALDFLVEDERKRTLLCCMVSCLFARGIYKDELVSECLSSVGQSALAGKLDEVGHAVQELRWATRFTTGYDPAAVSIPKRFKEVVTWKGPLDEDYLNRLRASYAERIRDMAAKGSARLPGGKES